MVHCCPIWKGTAKLSHSNHNRVPDRLSNLADEIFSPLQPLFHRCNAKRVTFLTATSSEPLVLKPVLSRPQRRIILIPYVCLCFIRKGFFQETLIRGTSSHVNASPKTIRLISSITELIVIYHPYHHNLNSLCPRLTAVPLKPLFI